MGGSRAWSETAWGLRKTYMHTWLRAPTTCKATLEILSLNFSKSISWTEIRISQVSSMMNFNPDSVLISCNFSNFSWSTANISNLHELLPLFSSYYLFYSHHYIIISNYSMFYFINIRQWYWFFFNFPGNSYITCQYMGPCSCYNITNYYINVAFHCMGTNAM